MNITDMQSSKSEWNNDCTTGYLPQEHMDDNSQSKTLLDMTSTYDQLQNPNKKSKLTSYSYEKTTLLHNSTSSSSSSPSLSFNRPKSSSPSHEDSNYLMLNELMNSSDHFIQTTTTKTTSINDASKNLNQTNILLNNNNSENTSAIHISNQEEDNENTNDTVDEDDDDDDGDHDGDGDGDVDVCCYNPSSMVISDKSYSQMSSFKQTNDQCSINATTNNNNNNNYESRENDTYLNEINNNNNNNSNNMKDVCLINHESTDMIPLVKKQRYSSPNDLNTLNALNEHESEQFSSNTRIPTSVSQGILNPLDKSSSFQRIEYGINQALSSNENIPTQNDFRTNESNESIQLNNNHSDYKFKEFQSSFEYPSQYTLNYPNIHTSTTINNNSGTVTGDHHRHHHHHHHQSHYPLNSPHLHHQHPHLQEEQHRQQIKDYSSCSTSSPLQNYFSSSLPFEHLSRYSDYNNNSTNNTSNNNIGFIKESNRLNLNSAQNELINHSMLNKDIEHLRKSIMNKTIPPLNNINDNYSTEKLLTFNQNLNNTTTNNNNTPKHTPHLSSIPTTTTNEHLLNNRHIEPPFASVISNNLNENIIPRLVSHSIVTPLQSNHSSSRTIPPSYPRNINECTENLSRLGHLNWASNNSTNNTTTNNSSHPYNRGQTGYSTEFTNTTRRRNATKESTTTLKAWLQEHIKNPYPTKGEKIMLAIITKMTLTQVSTWFANARRRLKKENKMTWTPKHRGEEQADDDDDGDDDEDDEDGDEDDMDDAGDDADANGHVDDNEEGGGDGEVDNRRVNHRHRDDRHRKDGKHRNVDNNNLGDNDQEDEMTGSDEELNIMELASSQNRNHSTLNNYFKNYSSDKHNKSMIKPDLFKTNFHENESYNSNNNNNSLMNMKKFDEFHHFPLISSYPTPNTSFLMNQIQPNLNATTNANTTTVATANTTFDSLFNEQYDKMNLTLNQLNTFNKNQCVPPHKAFENNNNNNTNSATTHITYQLNNFIENHINEFKDKIDKKKFNVNTHNTDEVPSTEMKLTNMSGRLPQSNWTDMINPSSVMKYDSIPFGSYYGHPHPHHYNQSMSLPHYAQENSQVPSYIHALNSSNRTYPVNQLPMTDFMNASSSCSSSTVSPGEHTSLLMPSDTTTTGTTTTTTETRATEMPITPSTTSNSLYTQLCNFPNSIHLLSPTPFNSIDHNSEVVSITNNNNMLSLTNILNSKEFLSPKLNRNENHGEASLPASLLTPNDTVTSTLGYMQNCNNNNNKLSFHTIDNIHNSTVSEATTRITTMFTSTASTTAGVTSPPVSTLNSSLWSPQLQQSIRVDESNLSINSGQTKETTTTTPTTGSTFWQSTNSSLTVPISSSNNNNNNSSRQRIIPDDFNTSPTLWSDNQLLHDTYNNSELNHHIFYQPLYNSMNTMPTR